MKRFIWENCILKGSFALSGGGMSDFYFDMKKAFLNPYFINALIDYYGTRFCPWNGEITMLGGYGMGAALMIPSLIFGASRSNIELKGAIVRKPKDHGTKNYIENQLPGRQKISVVDDVLTTGASINIAYSAFKEVRYEIKEIIVLVNRADTPTTRDISDKYKIPVTSIFNATDFDLDHLK